MAHYDILPYSMNLVEESYDNFGKEGPPKWKIMCMKKYDDKTISDRLKPHAKLRIRSQGFTKENFPSEVDFSHLIILPPLSINSLNVTLTTIARGKPIIVPLASESDYFIEKYFSDFHHNMVVDMRSKSDELKEKIVDVIKNYAMHLNYASRVRDIMKNEVMKEVQETNSQLFDYIQQYVQLPEESTGHLSRKDTDTTRTSTFPSTSMQAIVADQSSPGQTRKPGSLEVQVETSYGSAVEGSSMADVTERFHKIEGSRPVTEGTGKVLSDTHKDVDVEKVVEGCLRYVTKCGSLEALEALWSEYISGRLDKTIHSTIITPTLLSKIHAHYLTLDIYIPVQEYLLCKREIPLLTGSQTSPLRRRSVAAITELKSGQPRNVDRNHTVDCLNLVLSQIQIRDGQNHSGLLSRDDLKIPELHLHRMTFATKRDKVRLDVHVRRGKLWESFSKRDRVDSTLNAELTSIGGSMNETISDFVHLKIHSSKHSKQQKAVLHEAGQKLLTQREHVTNQTTPLKEKSEARNVVIGTLQSDLERVHQGYPVKGSVLEVFGSGSMPGQFNWARGIYIKNNGQWVICDGDNHRVQVIDPIKLCCDLILQFHAFPKSFDPWNVTVDEDNDQYFMSDRGNGQVVVSSGQSKILNCFGRKEGIDPSGICLSPDGFIFIGDDNGYVRKYNKSGEHIARTEKGQVSVPWI
ncbi:uncharacterized protein [Ptychodera flava]|uniref:uncharacterized protein isoform X2 n=1 Tax=Ptychodera flava TaxID=63121 RepID=UPI00396AA870